MNEEEVMELNDRLGVYGIVIWATIMHLQKEGKKLTMEAIHARSVEYQIKHRLKFEEGSDITKMLPILAVFDKAAQVWNLKSNKEILQSLRQTKTRKVATKNAKVKSVKNPAKAPTKRPTKTKKIKEQKGKQ